MKKTYIIGLTALFVLGFVLRLWNINFGLPHSWYADEPEIGEPAIKNTYEIRRIIKNNDYYKLAPQSYVYGTFPVYTYTLALMAFSKFLGVIHIVFSKMDLYIFMRVLNALQSQLIAAVLTILLAKILGKNNRKWVLLGVFLAAFNWKFIVHAHYLNNDITITLLILLANLFFYLYMNRKSTTKYVVLSALFFGLALSTKITVLMTLPVYLFFFLKRKDYISVVAYSVIIAGVFIITNPFSVMFAGDFIARMAEMRVKEAGMVFDSVDYSPFKYLSAISYILTLPIFLFSILGMYRLVKFKNADNRAFLLTPLDQIIIYILFFSIQSRRVDRWMLPIIPNLMIFAVIGAMSCHRKYFAAALALSITVYLYYPVLLLNQFQRNTPRSAAYIWSKENLPENSPKYGLTEEGLDPMNKLPFSTIRQFNPYESEGAQFFLPPDVSQYEYIYLSSRPLSWTQNTEVKKKYPEYSQAWKNITKSDFKLVKAFNSGQPNLIPLSSIYIYRNISYGLLK